MFRREPVRPLVAAHVRRRMWMRIPVLHQRLHANVTLDSLPLLTFLLRLAIFSVQSLDLGLL